MPEIPEALFPRLSRYRQEADAYEIRKRAVLSHGEGDPIMKALSVIGLLFAAAILATVPVSPQVTSSGVELSLDQAQAQTYRRARVTARRVGRRSYRYARRAYRRGYAVAPSYYGATSYGYGYPSSYGYGYGYPSSYGYGYGYPSIGFSFGFGRRGFW